MAILDMMADRTNQKNPMQNLANLVLRYTISVLATDSDSYVSRIGIYIVSVVFTAFTAISAQCNVFVLI